MNTEADKKKRAKRAVGKAEQIADPIIFRIPSQADRQALLEKAEAEGKRPNLMARDLVVSALHGKGISEDISIEIECLRKDIFDLREELSLVAEVLLAAAGRVSSAEASGWVDKNLKPRRP